MGLREIVGDDRGSGWLMIVVDSRWGYIDRLELTKNAVHFERISNLFLTAKSKLLMGFEKPLGHRK